MIALIIALAFVGVILYFIAQIPMDPIILTVIRVVIILCVVYYLMRLFGVVDLPIPSAR